MADKHIVVLDYGMGNIHSIVKALRLYSSQVEFTSNPSSIDDCDALVLPGDGAFQAGMENLAGPKEEHLRRFLDSGRPMLGICIGFQLLFHDSSEVHNPDGSMGEGLVPGLKLIPGLIRRFSGDDVRVPHMGWNTLKGCSPDSGLTDGDWMYFQNSHSIIRTDASHR